MASGVDFLSNGKPAETVYALPTQLRNSPVYCSSVPGNFITRKPDELKRDGGRINVIASDAVLEMVDGNKELIDSINVFMTNKEVQFPLIHRTLMKIFGNSRHFVIPMPGSFLNVNAISRGDVDETNSYATQTRQLLNSIEFLLSAKGIKFAWAGILPGEELPKNLRPVLKEGEKPPKRYEAKRPIARCVVEELNDLVHVNTSEDDTGDAHEGIFAVPDTQTMTVKVSGEEGYLETHEIPRFQMYWEFVPLFNKVNINVPKNLQGVFPDHQLLDAETPLGYLLCHVDILDPQLDLMAGFRRLYAKQLLKEEKGMREQSLDALAAKYCIEPRAYVTMMAMLSSDESLAAEMEYQAPGINLFRHSQPLNICNVLGIKPVIENDEIAGPSEWRAKFRMSEFERDQHRIMTDPNIPKEHMRPQLQYDRHFKKTPCGYWIYCFPAPNRVIRIDPPMVYPTVLNKCIIPFYNKSTKRRVNVDIQFNPNIRKIQHPYNVTCPEMEFRTQVMLEDQIRLLINKDTSAPPAKEQTFGSYAVDVLREQLPGGDMFSESFKACIKEDETPPIVTSKTISEFLIRDIEREPHCPTQIGKIFDYMKTERKRDASFSLFHDLFDKDGLDFKYYADLSLASTYSANFSDFLDWHLAMYQSHKHFQLLDKVIMMASKLRFGNQIYVMVTGPSNRGKSYTKDVALMLAIKGSLKEVGSETKKVKESGYDFTGWMVLQDDAGAGNSDMFDGGGDEKEADAIMKTALSAGYSSRTKYDKDTGKVLEIWTDLRRSVWCNSNAETGIAASLLSRTLLLHVGKCDRILDMSRLDMRVQQADPLEVNKKRELFTSHYRNKQVFCTLVLYFARAGGIQYDYQKEGRAVVSKMLKRFKEVFSTNILKRSAIPITSRMEQGQIYPITEGIMLERVFASICSGVFRGKTKHLYPGAPFSYDFLTELNELGLLLPIEEDVLKAISYYEDIASQETTQEIVNFIKFKMTQKRQRKGSAGFTDGDFMLQREIYTNSNCFVIPGQTSVRERGWEKHWFANVDVFFKRNLGGVYITDYNWIDLVKLCDLPNNYTSTSYLIEKFAEAIKNYNPSNVFLDKNVIMFHLGEMLINEDGAHEFQMLVTRMCPDPYPELKEAKEKGSILSTEMQVSFEAKDRSSTTTACLNLRTLWLRDQLKETGAVHKTVCYPLPDEDGQMSRVNFMGSTCEAAIQLAACHDDVFEQTILLDGMRFNRASPYPGETREIKDMPHIMKQVRIIDTSKDPEDDNYRKYIIGKSERLGVETGLVVRFDEKTGQGEVFARSGEDSLIDADWDYFSTKVYLQRILDRMRAYGHYMPDGSVLREDEKIRQEFADLVMNKKIYRDFSPVGVELLFRKQRDDAAREKEIEFPDYQSSKIEAEIELINSGLQKMKKRKATVTEFMEDIGIFRAKRAMPSSLSQVDTEEAMETDAPGDNY